MVNRMINEEYIKREALLKEIQEEIDYELSTHTDNEMKWICGGLKVAMRDIRNQPAADVVSRDEIIKIFEEIEKIITAPFTAGFDVLLPINKALCEYNRDLRKELLYYIAQVKEKYTKGGEGNEFN